MSAPSKELEIVMLPQVEEFMRDNPEAAGEMRELFANMRQAADAVQRGQYATFEDAMEAITGHRPEPVDFEEPFS